MAVKDSTTKLARPLVAIRPLLRVALSRLTNELTEVAPSMGGEVSSWIKTLSLSSQPERHFTHPLAFPMLALPWWLEKEIHGEPDLIFQASVIYSTINGYYFIRLIDDVMDGHMRTKPTLLPALAFFHTNFQAPYFPYFGADHDFWNCSRRIWFSCAEATHRDVMLNQLTKADFLEVAARKNGASMVPLAAVCLRYDRRELLPSWCRFAEMFGCWHQMADDLFDWLRDLENKRPTYLLSEAHRQKHSNESVAAWIIRDGFDWGIAALRESLGQLKALARELQSDEIEQYLMYRDSGLRAQQKQLVPGLKKLKELADLLEPTPGIDV